MIFSTSILVVVFLVLALVTACLRLGRRSEAFDRLLQLSKPEFSQTAQGAASSTGKQLSVEALAGKLGRAGYVTNAEKRRAHQIAGVLIAAFAVLGAFLARKSGLGAGVACALGGAYVGLTAWLFYLRRCTADIEREVLFQLPLVLESVILLVEAGMGILPALEQVSRQSTDSRNANPVLRILQIVYQLSAGGMTFSQALEMVAEASQHKTLRHVLLHLDVSSTEGGELVPSLRALSNHAHTEWRLSVEERVSRLEGLVVFPVFASVLGLMLLTAAVPLVPVLEFMESIDANRATLEKATEEQS